MKYSDNQHRLASLEPAAAKENSERSVASVGEGEHEAAKTEGELPHEGAAKTGMSDQDISKLAEEFADDGKVKTEAKEGEAKEGEHGKSEEHAKSEEHGKSEEHAKSEGHGKSEEHAEAKAESREHSAKHAEVSSAAEHLAEGREPVTAEAEAKPKEARRPSSLPKDVAQYSVGKFTLQIAAFPKETEAKERAEDLKSKGYSAFYSPASVNGKTWYRVNVGLFASEKEAKDYRSEFTEKSKVEGAMVKRIVE